jgi:hypothetical protein
MWYVAPDDWEVVGMKAALEVDATKILTELPKLWDRGSLLLWALAIGSFLGFAVLAALALTGSPTLVQANDTWSRWLLPASILLGVLALAKQYQERTIQTVKLFPDERKSYYLGPFKQTDGSINTQIVLTFDVFNLTDKSIWLPEVTLIRPRSHAPVRVKAVSLKDQSSDLYGGYELPPHGKTRGVVNVMIQEDLTQQIAREGVAVSIKDQFGHRHKIKLLSIIRSVEFPSVHLGPRDRQ